MTHKEFIKSGRVYAFFRDASDDRVYVWITQGKNRAAHRYDFAALQERYQDFLDQESEN